MGEIQCISYDLNTQGASLLRGLTSVSNGQVYFHDGRFPC